MGLPATNPALPTISLYCGVTSAVLIPFGFVVGTIGNIAGAAWRPAALMGIGLAGFAWLGSPCFAVAAVATGRTSRRRFPNEEFGKAGLIIGICALALLALLAGLGVVTWLSISTR